MGGSSFFFGTERPRILHLRRIIASAPEFRSSFAPVSASTSSLLRYVEEDLKFGGLRSACCVKKLSRERLSAASAEILFSLAYVFEIYFVNRNASPRAASASNYDVILGKGTHTLDMLRLVSRLADRSCRPDLIAPD